MDLTPVDRRLKIGAAVASLVIVSFLVVQASGAVFTDQTTAGGNDISAGDLSITNDHGATAMFQVTALVPNDTITRCITVQYTGDSVGADLTGVRLYANSTYNDTVTASGAFSSKLKLTIRRDDSFVGTAGVPTNCTGFVSDATLYDGAVAGKTIEGFTDTDGHVDFANGVLVGWTPAATGETRGFQFVISFDTSASNDFQNAALGTSTPLGFTWEIQSGSGTAK
jgi:hypothetical protein